MKDYHEKCLLLIVTVLWLIVKGYAITVAIIFIANRLSNNLMVNSNRLLSARLRNLVPTNEPMIEPNIIYMSKLTCSINAKPMTPKTKMWIRQRSYAQIWA